MFRELIKDNTILVVGDYMLDSYWFGNVTRISPEAPVPVFQMFSKRSVAGGTANVVANLIAAGKQVIASSVIGKDSVGDELVSLLQNIGCDCSMLQRNDYRRTIEKTRLLAQNNQQLLRVDEEEIIWLTKSEENQLVSNIEGIIDKLSAIILSDYMKGILTESLCRKIIGVARKNNIPVYCDVKDTNVEKYKYATLLKPNKKELEMLTGMSTDNENQIKAACQELCKRCRNEYILVTLGSKGMALYTISTDTIEFIPSEPKEVYDVSGAGDTVISYLVACISSGIDIGGAVKYANKAAGIKVGKVGTSTVSLIEMEEDIMREAYLHRVGEIGESKICTLKTLLNKLNNQSNKKIVFTNGCFDILHAGHVMYLQKAAEYGDVLIVGVNNDESVRRLKGAERPINSLEERIAVLAGLSCITYIVSFDEDTPETLIRSIKPDVLVKGADYKGKFIAGADYVKTNGGEVVLIPILEGHSTTNIIKKSGGSVK